MLDIFATDPAAKAAREEREAKFEASKRPAWAFQLRSGKRSGNQPVSLREWRITAPKHDTISALKELFGGVITEAPNGDYALDTELDRLEVIIDASKIESKLIQWADGLPIHECDGSVYLSPEADKGKPCDCPKLLDERKEKAKQRRGPKPNIVLPLRFPQDEGLGLGKYTATAWSFAEDLPYVMAQLSRIDGEALCALRLDHIEYEKNGKPQSFTKPVLNVIGSYQDAIAGDPED
ncbi:hypothetical protein phiSA1p29 [Streptomyces phage phiSASD1]|uniref:Gp6 n=1 Tax=Streptomyces phage phiSASD1 TaxID=747763 RepID=D7NW75_9CAUD|nr:hypothetical protein phiSA1p29 [Streptomyces phage phiSASD1]ADE43473.1 gp6 [Streptomyces phage phiSASD1]